jgi:hypothetical protein
MLILDAFITAVIDKNIITVTDTNAANTYAIDVVRSDIKSTIFLSAIGSITAAENLYINITENILIIGIIAIKIIETSPKVLIAPFIKSDALIIVSMLSDNMLPTTGKNAPTAYFVVLDIAPSAIDDVIP